MDEEPVIKVEHVSKVFKLPHEKQSSIKGALINFRKRNKSYEIQEALHDISFEVKKGEFFGIIGRNGSGKSTMLKLLAGIYAPTSGHVTVRGMLTPFIELGVGFNAELTGRENVFLNGALLGFSRKEMQAMYQRIVDFAEIERFMDQKLKNYSSGMQVRLAFSIAIQAQNDILLIDEVLAVGDLAFQEKCYRVFEEIKNQGKTVVFISHDGGAIQRFCDRVVIIDQGKVVNIGEPQDMVLEYGALIADEQYSKQAKKHPVHGQHQGSGAITIKKVSMLSKLGKPSGTLRYGERFAIELQYTNNRPIDGLVTIGVEVVDDQGVSIVGPNTRESKENIRITGDGVVRVAFEYNPLSPKTYTINAGFYNDSENMAYDLVVGAAEFKVVGKGRHGKIHIEPKWSFSQSSPQIEKTSNRKEN